jgi:putative transposase
MPARRPLRHFQTSPEVIRLVVMLYAGFPLWLENVKDDPYERGIAVSRETMRFWWTRFGSLFASEIRQKRRDSLHTFSRWRRPLDGHCWSKPTWYAQSALGRLVPCPPS